jgi:hypothetical protein
MYLYADANMITTLSWSCSRCDNDFSFHCISLLYQGPVERPAEPGRFVNHLIAPSLVRLRFPCIQPASQLEGLGKIYQYGCIFVEPLLG